METIETPKVRPDGGASFVKSILEKVRAKAVPMVTESVPEPKVEEKKETPSSPAVDPKIAEMTKELEASRAKIAELEGNHKKEVEALNPDASTLRECRDLWKSGKKMEAISKLAGLEELGDELDDVLVAYAARPSKETKSGVEKTLDEIVKRLDAKDQAEASRKENETKEAEAKRKAEEAKIKADAEAVTSEILDKFKGEFDLCNREGNRQEVIEKSGLIALAILERDKVDIKKATRVELEKAMKEAFGECEKALEEEGKRRFLKEKKEEAEKKAASQVEKTEEKPAVRGNPPVKLVPPADRVTLDALLARNRKNARYS